MTSNISDTDASTRSGLPSAPPVAIDDFYRPAHRDLYEALLAIGDDGAHPDPTSAAARVGDTGALDSLLIVRRAIHLGLLDRWNCRGDIPTLAGAPPHRRAVRDARTAKETHRTAEEVATALARGPRGEDDEER